MSPSVARAAHIRPSSTDALTGASGFDAIVVGTGLAGRLAAHELVSAGLKVLALGTEAARPPPRLVWPSLFRRRNPVTLGLGPAGGGRPTINEELRGSDGRPAWPVSAAELQPWREYVEHAVGAVGELGDPAGAEAPARELIGRIESRWPGASPRLAAAAALAKDPLDLAARDKRMFIRFDAAVRRVSCGGRQTLKCVTWVDRRTGREMRTRAPLVFLCGPAIETTRILMCSQAPGAPEGIGLRSGVLGRGLIGQISVEGEGRVRVRGGKERPSPAAWIDLPRFTQAAGVDAALSARLAIGSPSGRDVVFRAVALGVLDAGEDDRLELHPTLKDGAGVPAVRVVQASAEARRRLTSSARRTLHDLADLAGARMERPRRGHQALKTTLRAFGTARMGARPETSVLNPWNECWDAPGLYVTGGAALPGVGGEAPDATVLALTARAAARAAGASPPSPRRFQAAE
jgi:choline dehydrogenase-like flavoprotein